MAPVWSRTTTPISLLFSVLKIALSKFILMNLASGGFHIAFGFGTAAGEGGSTARNSSKLLFGLRYELVRSAARLMVTDLISLMPNSPNYRRK